MKRHTWQEELEIVDRTMKAISGVTDPEELVGAYWSGIGDLLPITDYVALSRRGVEPPYFLVTRSSRFTEDLNPWTQRDRLPRLTGGILGEIAYANKPVIIEDLAARLRPDDPGYLFLEGYGSLFASPQYDGGEGINVSASLLRPGQDLDPRILPMLHWQSGLFGRGTHNLVLRNQLAAALADLDRELEVVGEIQRSLLPARVPEIEGFEIAASYLTSARAGGDYYDFFPLHDGGWGIFIADVSGHGTPAAVLMAITHAIAHAQPGTHTPPGSMLGYLNRTLARSYTREGTFETAFYAVLEPRERRLTYSAAGHNPPRLVRGGRVMALDGASALPMGIEEGQRYREASVMLERGDVLVLYTDGITEAMAPRREGPPELFGVERLDGVLVESAGRGAQEMVDRIGVAVQEFSGKSPPADDQTVIVVRCG
jgi:sigma-B regulation protein RsbU (phosphoserine phosphatase)